MPAEGRSTSDVNFVVFRENTEGLYAGVGGRFKAGTEDEVAIQEEINTYKGVHRIIRHAFEHARTTGRTRVCMADKSNAMPDGHALWQRVFREVAAEYPDIESRHLYIDALALLLVQDPSAVRGHRHEQPLRRHHHGSGGGAAGRSRLAASGNIHPGRTSMFEPVHGSAPPLAGKNVANPMGAMLRRAMMLDVAGPFRTRPR